MKKVVMGIVLFLVVFVGSVSVLADPIAVPGDEEIDSGIVIVTE